MSPQCDLRGGRRREVLESRFSRREMIEGSFRWCGSSAGEIERETTAKLIGRKVFNMSIGKRCQTN